MKGEEFTQQDKFTIASVRLRMHGKFARSLLLFPLPIMLSANYRYSSNKRDGSIYKSQRSRHSLPWITTPSILITLCPPFSSAHSHANKGKSKAATLHSSPTSNSFTLRSGSLVFLLPSFCPTHKSIPELSIRTTKQLSREHAEQGPTISNIVLFPGSLYVSQASCRVYERLVRRLKTSLEGIINIAKKTITSLPGLFYVGTLYTDCLLKADASPRAAAGNRSGITKHPSIPYRKTLHHRKTLEMF